MGQTSFINRARLNLAKAIAPRTATPSRRELWPYGDGAYSGYRLQWARRMPELRLDPYGVALAAETSVWAKACIDLRAAAVSRMPWTITDAAGNELENTPFHNMMRYARLSYQQNLFALWETSLSVHGETYLEKLNNSDVPGFMIPGGLRILNAIAMTPQIVAGEVTHYQYIANGGKTRLEVSDVFVHRYNSLTDDFRASAPMITAMDAIGIKRSMQSFMRGHYDNDATPGGIVSPKAGVTANETWVNRIMSMWADTFKGSNNANSVGFIPAEIDFKQFDRKMPEHQQALSDDQIGEICAAFRVPVEMVRSAAAKDPLGGGGKMDSARAMFYEDFVEPECENIDAFINDVILPWLMPNSGAVFAFDYDETRSLISDTKERSDKIINEFNNGVITFNQMQIALDYEPIPGGDWYQFTPGKVIVMANQIANAPALMAAAAPKPPEPPATALPTPPAQPQLPAAAEPAKDVQPLVGKSAAVMLSLANHPDLVSLQNQTRKYVGDTPVQWNAPDSFHVTVLTAPTVTDEQVNQLKSVLDEIPVPELSLKVGSLGAFHTIGEHAVHFKIRSNQALSDYQEAVYQKCIELGIPVSGYSLPDEYKPHVTMGYAADKVSPQSYYSGLAIKPTELHLGVGEDIVYKKPVGNVITQVVEPVKAELLPIVPQTPIDRSSRFEFDGWDILPSDDGQKKYNPSQDRAANGEWTDGGGSITGGGNGEDKKPTDKPKKGPKKPKQDNPATDEPKRNYQDFGSFDESMVADSWQSGAPMPTQQQADAMEYYRDITGNADMNRNLRMGTPVSKQGEEHVKQLDSILNKSEIPYDAKVYRGIPADSRRMKEFEAQLQSGELKVGSVMHDKGYASTSLNSGIAGDKFDGAHGGVTFTIDAPKGTPGLYMNSAMDKFIGGRYDGEFRDERELLFPRDSNFRIDSIEKSGTGYNVRMTYQGVGVNSKEIRSFEFTLDGVEPFAYSKTALDELAQWEKKVKNKGVKAVFVNYLIRDEIADTLRSALATDGAEVKAAFAVAREQIAKKAVASTRLDFEGEFDDLLAKALANEADRRTWAASLRYLLNKYGKLAFADGLTDGGLDSGEMDDEDKDTLAAHLAEQSQYVTGLGEAIYKQDAVDDRLAQQKATMWFNKSINPLYQAGLLSADKNGLFEWVYGDTEHCADCKTMNGQRHRLKDYARKGIQPKADSLACKGFNCACSYVRVSGKARGNWLGSGKAHEHAEAA